MKLLHIIATPRISNSNTLRVSNQVIASLKDKYPDLEVQDLNLFVEDLPAATGDIIEAKYLLMSQQELEMEKRKSWTDVESRIYQFKGADIYLISTPMWNFGIPYALKFYIDTIVQPGYLYKYTEQGIPVPLVHDKKMICVTSRGGDYSQSSPMHSFDFQEPYLRAIFGFVGITDMQFLNLQPMDINLDIREAMIQSAANCIPEIVAQI